MAVAHFTFDFSLWHKSGNRVDNDYINSAASDKCFGNFKCVLTCIRLWNEERVNIYSECSRIGRVKCVLNIYKGNITVVFLSLCNAVEWKRGFTRRFRAVNFNDSASWKTADTECDVKCERTCLNVVNIHMFIFAKAHNCTFTELLFYLSKRSLQRFFLI